MEQNAIVAPPEQGSVLNVQQVYALSREDLILRIFFSDGQLSLKMRPHLDPELFKDSDNKTIAQIIKKFEKKYERVPTAQELVTGMGATSYATRARDKIIAICNTPMQALHSDYVLTMVESFFQERMAEQILTNAAEAISERNTEAIRDLINPLRIAVTFSLHMDLGINMYSDAETALKLLTAQKECIPSAVNEIRYYTGYRDADGVFHGGGYYRKTLFLYAGQPNVGKSIVMCSDAGFAYMNGYNVLYVSLELSEDYVWQRIAANICDLEYYQILAMTPDECRARIDARRAEMGDSIKRSELQVKRLKSTTTPAEIEALVDSFEIAFGKLDLLVIDYLSIMRSGRSRSKDSSMYADGVEKAAQIRDMAIDRNIAVMSAVQFNRNGYHTLDAGIESIEGSSGYSETCDIGVSIVSDEVLRSCGLMCHSFWKNRFGQNYAQFVAKCDFAHMRWFSPTQDEIDHYNEARAEADVEQNASQGGNGGKKFGGRGNNQVRRAGTKPAAAVGQIASPGNLTVQDESSDSTLETEWDGV